MARLRLRFVNSFRDRHGRTRDYFRRPGCKAIPLPGLPCPAEYIEAYQAALAGVPVLTREVGASRTQPGTINAAIVAYYRHPMFTEALAPATQTMRRNVLERFPRRAWRQATLAPATCPYRQTARADETARPKKLDQKHPWPDGICARDWRRTRKAHLTTGHHRDRYGPNFLARSI